METFKIRKVLGIVWKTLLGVAAAWTLCLLYLLVFSPAVEPAVSDPTDTAPPDRYAAVWKNPKDVGTLSLNFSPYYLPGANPELGTEVTEEVIRSALDAIAPVTDTIRTFGVSGELFKLYPIAKEAQYGFEGRGFRVIAGCWIGRGYSEERIQEEIEILAYLGNEGLADMLIIGSEGLFRGDYSAESLIGYFDTLRGLLTRDVPIGTSDTAGALLSNPEVLQASDVALYTFYPGLNGVPIENAVEDFANMVNRLQRVAGKVKLICSETGYQFEDGVSTSAYHPNPEDAARYFTEIIQYSRTENIEVIYFEAIEESVWKSQYKDGGWALFDANLEPRPSVREALEEIAKQYGGGSLQ